MERRINSFINKNGRDCSIKTKDGEFKTKVILKFDFKRNIKEDRVFLVAGRPKKNFIKGYALAFLSLSERGDRLILEDKKYYINHCDEIFYKTNICFRLYLSLEED